MWRFDLDSLTDDDLFRLRMLVRAKKAVGHIVVRSDLPWPVPVRTSPRQWQEPAEGAAIH